MHEKNNEIGQNFLVSQVRELWGAVAPFKISNISDFDEIWIIYVYLYKKTYENNKNSLGVYVRELWV